MNKTLTMIGLSVVAAAMKSFIVVTRIDNTASVGDSLVTYKELPLGSIKSKG